MPAGERQALEAGGDGGAGGAGRRGAGGGALRGVGAHPGFLLLRVGPERLGSQVYGVTEGRERAERTGGNGRAVLVSG